VTKVGHKQVVGKQTGRNQYSILAQIYSIVHTFTSFNGTERDKESDLTVIPVDYIPISFNFAYLKGKR
jgi:hypothetical protein